MILGSSIGARHPPRRRLARSAPDVERPVGLVGIPWAPSSARPHRGDRDRLAAS